MKDKVVVIGLTQFSKWVFESIEQDGKAEVVAFSVEKAYYSEQMFLGVPVYPIEELGLHFDMKDVQLLVTIGYSKMNQIRERICKSVSEKGWRHYTYVSSQAVVDSTAIIEAGSIVMPCAYIGPYVHIGKSTIVNVCAVLSHEIEVGDYCFIAPHAVFGGNSTLGNNCFIGLNATIMNGVKVAGFNLIGASAYVPKNTMEYGCYVMPPTKRLERFKSTDIVDMV